MNPTFSKLGGKQRSEPVPPKPHGFVRYIDTAFEQQVFDLPQRQWQTNIHHHGEPDDLG
jgi:hypothetical protein